MAKAWKCGVITPIMYFVDPKRGLLVMEYIEGKTMKQTLVENHDRSFNGFAAKIGTILALLHSNGIIHGDLTTSNILLSNDGCVMIDFGLSSISNSIEDRAVDLYVLERSILSTHPEIGAPFFSAILESYGREVSHNKATMAKLAEVQKRGRKRDMSG